jgi:uncharacterized protein
VKIYFYDTGVRNAMINDFRSIDMRDDKGALWENFLISERLKSNHYALRRVNSYFWRTHQKSEIDYIEEVDGKLEVYEFKWNPKTGYRIPKAFTDTYNVEKAELISLKNFHQFLS